ncbi:hypothetical protein LTR56_007338 [Elasticomyces elasticus]|nr:hypothetical protein LTR22_019670 [Elasticomyces elasticus]KAK3648515.1 hypothetical protein LTR56_007338 [Elasticomyces elasticus]KAK4930477.1 hypothetical protein LTR49_002885 [Elasticomyces elasticus]
MANRKDMRREDLIVPYTEPEEKKDASSDIQGTMASTLPMAAIFTRNKMIGWTSVIFAVQGWLSETAATKSSQATPAIFSVGMAFLSLGVMSVFSDLMKDYIEVVAWTVIMTVIRRPGESSCFDPTALSQYIAYRYSVVKLSWAVVAAADKTLKTIDNGYETPDFILGPFAALSCIFTMWAMGDVNWADVYLAGAWALIGLLFQE